MAQLYGSPIDINETDYIYENQTPKERISVNNIDKTKRVEEKVKLGDNKDLALRPKFFFDLRISTSREKT